MASCSTNILSDVWLAFGNEHDIIIKDGEELTTEELNNRLELDTIDTSTESGRFEYASKSGEVGAQLLRKRPRGPESGGKKLQKGGETTEEKEVREYRENQALLAAVFAALVICEAVYGSDYTSSIRSYLANSGRTIIKTGAENFNNILSGVIDTYAKALPGYNNRCTTAMDWTIDSVRKIPFAERYFSLGNQLPSCSERAMAFTKTTDMIRVIGTEVVLMFTGGAVAVGASEVYKDLWNNTGAANDYSAKVVAICKQIGSDSYSIGAGTISSILYIPMMSVKALGRIVPNTATSTWRGVKDVYNSEWFKIGPIFKINSSCGAKKQKTNDDAAAPVAVPVAAPTAAPVDAVPVATSATPSLMNTLSLYRSSGGSSKRNGVTRKKSLHKNKRVSRKHVKRNNSIRKSIVRKSMRKSNVRKSNVRKSMRKPLRSGSKKR